jgi:DNA/RNA-binding domain of Phe-tRNA-synthetase-like protein
LAGITYRISPDIFEKYPSYARGVVLAFGVDNIPYPTELVSLLRQAEGIVRQQLTLDRITEYPRIKAWREAYKAFGAKPSEFRSSVEAMARRVLRGDQLPSINTLVDIGNAISLEHLVPVGGHSIDKLTQDIELRLSTGNESFIPFGGNELEHPLAGEVIFVEGMNVLTRRWTWRQANHTITLPETRNIEFNIDRLPPVEIEEIHSIAVQVMALVEKYCGGKMRYEVLDSNHSQMQLTLE